MTPFPVLVHSYPTTPTKTLPLYEHPSPSPSPPNALIFLGGLGDGPHTVPYPLTLSHSLPPTLGFSLFQARLTSSFSAFGYSSLSQDCAEISSLVRYLRSELKKQTIVLMGHSTGCQDCMFYCTKLGELEPEEKVDGIVLQGPVSDREALVMSCCPAQLENSIAVAKKMAEEGKGEHVIDLDDMPDGWKGSPVTAYRWLSLATKGGDDDFFSSDFSDEELKTIWGELETPVLILPSEKDEWVPFKPAQVQSTVQKWASFCKPGVVSEFSGLIPGANHRVDNTEGEKWLVERVGKFLGSL
ncbi:hypothetical protein QC761_705190 [Podospora bellae-mahoneyi]|uniref:Uncharacterized protein n=1 Tax=Podospora bellae-mahoneyi TaxID=2093777 RepID=A0ABR0F5B4_9PEZI|nr:hypothetical protein QC761_705190 [Podospora bellae-mahoneyi]